MISHSNGSNNINTGKEHNTNPLSIPWWTWVAPLFIANIGTWLSLWFKADPGTSLWYLPTALGIVMVYWWGPRALLGIYLNAVVCAPLWDLPWKWSFLYALPETIEVGLSWLLFVKLMRKNFWLPDLASTAQFLLFGSLIPTAFANVYLVFQLLLLGDIAPATGWNNWIILFSTDLATHLVLAVPALILFTKSMVKKGWANANAEVVSLPYLPESRNSKTDVILIVLVLILIFFMVIFTSIHDYWIVYGLLMIILAIRYGVNIAIIASSWAGTLALLLPHIMKNQLGLPTAAYTDVFIFNLEILFLCAVSLLTGRAISDLFNEITERSQAEAALRASEERLNLALTGSDDGLWDWNVQTGEAYFSPRWKFMLSYAEHEFPNTYDAWDSHLHPEDKQRVLETLQEHFNDEAHIYAPEFRMLTKTGSWIWIRARGRVVERDHEGHPLRMAGTHTDITERKRAEEKLRASEEHLEILHEIDRALLSAHSAGEIAKGALIRIRQLIPSPRASVSLFDMNKQEASFLSANLDQPIAIPNTPITFQEYGQRIIDQLQQNQPWVVNDILKDPQATELDKRLAAESGIHAWLCVPLLYHGQLIGSLNLGRGPDSPFTSKDAEIAHDVANQLAIAIQQTRLYEALQAELMERKLIEEKLRQSEEMYRILFDNVQVGVALTGKGKVLKYNETMLRQSGYTSTDIENLEDLNEFYFDLNDQQQLHQAVNNQGYVKEYPMRFKHRDGTPYDALLWMTPTTINGERYLQAVVQDITERKRAEQALRESEEKYRTLFETANSAIMLFDRTTFKVIDVNPVTCQLYGYTREEFLKLYVRDITAEVQATTDAIHGGATHVPLRYHKKKDGTIFPVEIIANRFTLADSAIQVAFVHDITERLRTDKEREEYIEKLGRQNAELERFTYTVSHDLRSPLVTIKGFLGMLEKDLRENRQERIQNDFQRIANATDKMQALLSDLLELSRIGRIINPPEEIDLGKLAHEAVESLDARIQATHAQVVIAPDLPIIFGDRIRLREVLENLIDNAAKYMGTQPKPVIEIGIRNQDDEQIIFVKDNGMGIEPRYKARVFSLFEKLNPASEGTGIGLALIKRIIETHGGKVWVESEGLGKGSTFCFTIPESRKTTD